MPKGVSNKRGLKKSLFYKRKQDADEMKANDSDDLV
jgi:hypothetical protein